MPYQVRPPALFTVSRNPAHRAFVRDSPRLSARQRRKGGRFLRLHAHRAAPRQRVRDRRPLPLLADRFDCFVHDVRNHGWNPVDQGPLRHNLPFFVNDGKRIARDIERRFGPMPTIGCSIRSRPSWRCVRRARASASMRWCCSIRRCARPARHARGFAFLILARVQCPSRAARLRPGPSRQGRGYLPLCPASAGSMLAMAITATSMASHATVVRSFLAFMFIVSPFNEALFGWRQSSYTAGASSNAVFLRSP